MDINTVYIHNVCLPPSPSCLVHIYGYIGIVTWNLYNISLLPLQNSVQTCLHLLDLPSDLSLEKKFPAMICTCRIFSLAIIELWPRKFVTCPRSYNLLIPVVHPMCTTYQFTQVTHGTSVQHETRTPFLFLGIYPFHFLLITPPFYAEVPPGREPCGSPPSHPHMEARVESWPQKSSLTLPSGCPITHLFHFLMGKNTSFVWACDRLAWLGRTAGFPNSCGCVSSWTFLSWLWFLSQQLGV